MTGIRRLRRSIEWMAGHCRLRRLRCTDSQPRAIRSGTAWI